MIRYRLHGMSPSHIRFGISPIHEAVSLVRMLAEPHRHPLHGPWIRRRAQSIAGLDTKVLRPMMRPGRYRPDFLDPPPSSADSTIDDA